MAFFLQTHARRRNQMGVSLFLRSKKPKASGAKTGHPLGIEVWKKTFEYFFVRISFFIG